MLKVLGVVLRNFESVLCAARGPAVQRKPLKHRDFEVNLESRLGKTQVRFFVISSQWIVVNSL